MDMGRGPPWRIIEESDSVARLPWLAPCWLGYRSVLVREHVSPGRWWWWWCVQSAGLGIINPVRS